MLKLLQDVERVPETQRWLFGLRVERGSWKSSLEMPKFSKNKKKSWRKQIDLNEVEEYFVDQRLDERVGWVDGNFIRLMLTTCETSKRAYEFILQTQGSGEHAETKTTKEKPKQIKRTSDIVSDLHCYKSLKVTTKVPAFVDRTHSQTKVKLPKLNKSPAVKEEPKGKKSYYDIWNTPSTNDNEFEEMMKMQNVLIGREPVNVPDHLYQKPTLRSPVEIPMAGQSYNPSKEDHQTLLKTAVEVEEVKLRKEEKLDKQVTSNFVKKSDIDPYAWMKEMSQGLGSGEEDETNDDSSEVVSMKKPILCKRKTKAQRAKERKNKLLMQKSKAKISHQEIGVKKVLRELRQKEALTAERMKKRDEKKIRKMTVGNESSVDDEIVVSLEDELKGSLRQVTVAGNLLEERFKSLQKRGLIEAKGKKTDDKKKKVRKLRKSKLFVKRSHRQVQ